MSRRRPVLPLTLAVALTAAGAVALTAPPRPDGSPSATLVSATASGGSADLGREVLSDDDGWGAAGAGTTGGAGAVPEDVLRVSTLEEFREAVGEREGDAPRIVYVEGTIDGNTAPDGTPLSCADYAVDGYTQEEYLAAYDPEVWGWEDPEGPLEEARLASSARQAERVRVSVGSNTTIVGADDDAAITGMSLRIIGADNVILRNLTISDAHDCFPGWDPGDGGSGNWNSEYDQVEISGATNVWVDHNTFDDGDNPGSELPEYFGRKYEVHDALLDIVRESDLITVSWNRFADRDKAMLLGNSDGRTTDRGRLRVTYHHNHFDGLGQRAPRVRYGRTHVYNNYYSVRGDHYQYSLGAGFESHLYAESNIFDLYGGVGAGEILANWGGTDVVEFGNATMDGGRGRLRPVDLVAEYNAANPDRPLGTERTWTPTYVERVGSVHSVRAVPRLAGAGRL
ncbi:polysaccharide lyase family 1 protein [Nocardiopsis sp. NPDC050513]|uniref:polysaccharide lyase family 1 protein n=1 Tax=Nocardiopsis sp. NPDC050513 TaxID=3364338 RepID=UPI00379AB736